MAKSNEEKEVIFKKCPICKKGEVAKVTFKSFFGLLSSNSILCSNCKAKFSEQSEKEEEKVFKLDLSDSEMKNAYDGQSLKVSEWERGTSDLDVCIQNKKLPNLKVVGLKTILLDDEKTHWYSEARAMEERMVRDVQFSSVGGRGFRIGQSKGESHGELKSIDSGSFLLTNKRLIFNGDLKHFEYPLNKITSIEEWKDAVEIASTNRQKCQVYVLDEPHKWAVYIKIAISLFSKSGGKSQTKANITGDIISDTEKHSLKEDIAKTQEFLEKMKEVLLKIQEKKNKSKK